jgi:hypothetical protein
MSSYCCSAAVLSVVMALRGRHELDCLTLPCCKPRICLMFWISAFPLTWAALASRTLRSLPLRR